MRIDELSNQACPLTQAVATVGDTWTLIILREMFIGATRFAEIQATSGISPLILTRRLRALEEENVIERREYRGRRFDYMLTSKGQDLFGVLLALKNWHERWHDWKGEKTVTLVHSECGKKVGTHHVCASCGRPVHANNARLVLSKTAAEARLQLLQAALSTERVPAKVRRVTKNKTKRIAS